MLFLKDLRPTTARVLDHTEGEVTVCVCLPNELNLSTFRVMYSAENII